MNYIRILYRDQHKSVIMDYTIPVKNGEIDSHVIELDMLNGFLYDMCLIPSGSNSETKP